MIKKILAVIVVIAVVVGALKFLKTKKDEVANLDTPKEMTLSVKITKAKHERVSKTREFLAQVQASNSAFIASKFSATIKKIYVDENDVVKKNQLLVSLDDSEIRANLSSLYEKKRALDIDVLNAKKILDRNKKLLNIDAISKESYDNSNVLYQNKLASLNTISDNIKELKSQLKYLNIKAPFDGVVGSKLNNEGSLAIAGKTIITLNSNDQKMTFSFVDGDEPILQAQEVYIDGVLIGEVIKRYDDAKNSLLVAEVKPYKSLAYANMSYVTIEVELESLKGCALPIDALLNKKDEILIMLYKDSKFIPTSVEVLIQSDTMVIVSECPKEPMAVASEAKLSLLPAFGNVFVTEDR